MTREHEDWCHAELKARCAEATKLRAEIERLRLRVRFLEDELKCAEPKS